MWNSAESSIMDINPGHPFAGQLSVSDMKLRLSHTMHNTESGRKINQAMVSTGRAVATTSKAVGGAISHAKGAFSSWFSNLLITPDTGQEQTEKSNDTVDSSGENPQLAQNDNEVQCENNARYANNCFEASQIDLLDGDAEEVAKTDIPHANSNCVKKDKDIVNGFIIKEIQENKWK